ncbi:ABC transporter permease [Candidatus Bipolaricaulota bacterium]|nr:ABC transporter permease [Candidatus Bipolaricaulota bacterium]
MDIFAISTLLATIRMAVPISLAALGGLFSESTGVINIALEGIILMGAFAGTIITNATGSPLLGIIMAVVAGIGMALIHAIASVTFKANHIISGVALNLFATGVTFFLALVLTGGSQISVESTLPKFLGVSPVIYVTIAIFFLSGFFLYRTRLGLRLRATGEHMAAVDSVGISVTKMRYLGVLISGALAGLGGGYLAIEQANFFTKGMSAGRGYIGLASMIFGKWTPWGAAGAASLFGFSQALQFRISIPFVPDEFLQMLPYLITIFVLVGAVGRATPPAEDGNHFLKEG